ncbi:MAG: FtsX-like permease family protein, partial [Bryobacteraceae bacterium]|nr:FtsX-like permease family protein [Bryobacteraceae bacterium]
TAGQPLRLVPAIRSEILTLDKGLEVGEMLTLRSHREAGLAQERLIATLLTGFAVLAVLLAAIGIYGVVSFAVAQRTRELGLRMALGADATSVLGLVLSRSLVLMVGGIALGLALNLALTRFVSSLLYGVTATDPVTFGASSALLAAVALLAAYLPARRATRIDPMEALRHE